MTKWEYRIEVLAIMVDALDLKALLKDMGDDGWELCAVFPITASRPVMRYAIFKRVKEEGKEG